MPLRIVEASIVNFLGRPIRLAMTCLVMAGLSTGETCLCASSAAACHSTALGAKLPAKACCCCGLQGDGKCHCKMPCCQKQAPNKTAPLQQDTSTRNCACEKCLSQAICAFTGVEGGNGWSGGSPHQLTSSASPATLQLQHVRLQI